MSEILKNAREIIKKSLDKSFPEVPVVDTTNENTEVHIAGEQEIPGELSDGHYDGDIGDRGVH